MNFDKVKPAKNQKPFIETKYFKVITTEENGKITQFKVTTLMHEKLFKVKNDNILAAWLLVEKHLKTLIAGIK